MITDSLRECKLVLDVSDTLLLILRGDARYALLVAGVREVSFQAVPKAQR